MLDLRVRWKPELMLTKIKICGISTITVAKASAEAGADYLGIVFEPHSRRLVELEKAKHLIASFRASWSMKKPRWVGVFANQTTEEVNHVLNYCNLDLAQLSGQESVDYCRVIVRPVIKVFHVGEDPNDENALRSIKTSLELYKKEGHMCMLDTYKHGVLGGTGQVFNWNIAKEISGDFEMILAGGLNPENVRHAVSQVNPWGIDVSSGVETDGQKDATKIANFISQARNTS